MDDFNNNFYFEELDDEPDEDLSLNEDYWQDLFSSEESALGFEEFFPQEIESEVNHDENDDENQSLEYAYADFLTNSITGGREVAEERTRLLTEERNKLPRTFWQEVLDDHKNEPPPKDFNEKIYRFFRKVAGVIVGLIMLMLMLLAFRVFLEVVDVLIPDEPTQSIAYERSSSVDYSNSYGDSVWGCPDGCTYHKDGCDIKGNKSYNTGEKIYHLPGQNFYDSTTINTKYGERWFCTEEEAKANGWRKSSN